jgi:hypothetical protein
MGRKNWAHLHWPVYTDLGENQYVLRDNPAGKDISDDILELFI